MIKVRKIGLSILMVLISLISIFFIYTRFFLDEYEMNDNTLVFNNIMYVRNDVLSSSDLDNFGKTIGIAFEKEKSVKDYIFPFWVSEYKNDKEHNHIFVRGFMDIGAVYEKEFH